MQVNRFWRRTTRVTRYIFDLVQLLEDHGYEVVPFAVQDPGNEPSPFSSLFVSQLDLLNPYRMPLAKMASTTFRMFYSREARNRIGLLADITHPDVAHIHNVSIHLSPSVLPAMVERGIGTVMTMHDSLLLCPAQHSYRDNAACYRCRPYHYLGCLTGKCMGGSSLASALCAAQLFAHDTLRAYTGTVDRFIAPSWFMADRLVARGIPDWQVVTIPYFVDVSRWPSDGGEVGDYIFYWGQVALGHGIGTLIRAVAGLPRIKLKIANSGMKEQGPRELAWELGADNVEFVGYQKEEGIRELLRGSRFVCVPYDSPNSAPAEVLEAFAAGKPVLATNIGGLPEVVREGVTGRLAEPGDVDSLRDAIDKLWHDPSAPEMGREARRRAENEYSPERHHQMISEVYHSVRRS